MRLLKSAVILASCALISSSCKEDSKDTAQVEKIPGIVLENMDTSIDPKQDFYNYVNGSWMKNTEIPADRPSWGGFSVLRLSLIHI